MVMAIVKTNHDDIYGKCMSSSYLHHVAEWILFRICPCKYIKIPILSAAKLYFLQAICDVTNGSTDA